MLEADQSFYSWLAGCLVPYVEVHHVLVGAPCCALEIALRLGPLVPCLLSHVLVGCNVGQFAEPIPGEVGDGGASGYAAALGVAYREHGRRCPLHGEPVRPDAQGCPDGGSCLPV